MKPGNERVFKKKNKPLKSKQLSWPLISLQIEIKLQRQVFNPPPNK